MSEAHFSFIRSLSSRQTLFQNRDVLRAGWLKYIPFAERLPSDEHKFWAVFAVYDENTPYIEFYKKRQPVSNHSDGPISKHSLLSCRHISSVISFNENHFEFTITLETHVIRLAAETEEIMLDWIEIVKTKLTSMNILKPPENLYSKSPVVADQHFQVEPPLLNLSFTSQPNELYEPIFNLSENLSQNMQQLSLGHTSHQRVPTEEGPPPYQFTSNQTENAQRGLISFRESQVEKLKKEMELITGLNLKVRKKDCYNAIAFVDILSHGIFIAGWKQKDHPHLHSTFHIGDQLVSINGAVMQSAAHARSYIKHSLHSLEVTVRRVPFGQVFCLKRSFEGEDLGLLRESGTAEINHIIPHSIAAKAGLLPKCTFYYDEECHSGQNWCLTEINNRPLNLFFKNSEVTDRLNAIGKEISILVQPNSFVRRLRKQLKACKNYKEYLVQ